MSNRYVWERYNFTLESTSVSYPKKPVPTSASTIYRATEINGNSDYSIRLINQTTQHLGNGMNVDIPGRTYFYAVDGNVRIPTTGVYYTDKTVEIQHTISGGNQVVSILGVVTNYLNYLIGSAVDTISNAASSTYPRHNYTGQITSICAVIPPLLRRCSHVE